METHPAKTVMIVDDDTTSRKLLRSILLTIGIQAIDEQENGEAAWDRLQAHPVELVLADWHMGDMSGLELVKRIRGDERFQQTKVIMVTSEDRRAQILEAIKAGVHGYIMKPFSKQNIQEKIRALFPLSETPTPSTADQPTPAHAPESSESPES